jgi:hypothetical protein
MHVGGQRVTLAARLHEPAFGFAFGLTSPPCADHFTEFVLRLSIARLGLLTELLGVRHRLVLAIR